MEPNVQADVLYCETNGRVAVTPAPGGRLDKLVHRYTWSSQALTVWLFGEITDWPHREGDGVTEFFHQRGVFSGSRSDAKRFLEMCCKRRLVVRYDPSLYVPCSAHPSRGGDDRSGGRMWDYSRREYECLRWDNPPTRVELVKLLAKVSVVTAEAASA